MRELEKDQVESTNTREIVLNSDSSKKEKKKEKTISTAKKTKFRWKYQIILVVGLAIMITVTVLLSLPTKMDKFLEKWKGANLTKETVIREVSEKDLLSKIEDKGYVFVFYGTPDSEDAVKKIQEVEKAAQLFKLEDITVYWLDATEINSVPEEDRTTTDFIRDLNARQEALQDVDLLKIPSFWFYNNGSIVRDTADEDDSAFASIVNNAFGEYASSKQQ